MIRWSRTPFRVFYQKKKRQSRSCFLSHESVRHSLAAYIQGRAKKWSPDLVSFVAAVAYHLCLDLPAAFTQHGDHFLADPCATGLS